MLDRPCPTNSRLTSSRWPERCASAFAIETDWPSAKIERAPAIDTNAGNIDSEVDGTERGGSIDGMAPMRVIAGHDEFLLISSPTMNPAIMLISMNGNLRGETAYHDGRD